MDYKREACENIFRQQTGENEKLHSVFYIIALNP